MNDWRAMIGLDPDPELEGLRVIRLTDRVVTTESMAADVGGRVVPPPTDEELGAGAKDPTITDLAQLLAAAGSRTATQAPALPSGSPAAVQDAAGCPCGEDHVEVYRHHDPAGQMDGVTLVDKDGSVTQVPFGNRERVLYDQANGTVRKQVGGLDTTNLAVDLAPQLVDDIITAFGDLQGSIDMNALIGALERGDTQTALSIIEGIEIPEGLEAARQTLRQAVIMVGGVATEQLAEALGLETLFELTSQAALEELEAFGAGMVTNVSDESMMAMRAILSEGYAEGRTATEIASQLRHSLGLTEPQVKQMLKLWDEWVATLGEDAATDKLAEWAAKKIAQRAETIALNELVAAGTRGQELVWEEVVKLGLIDPKTTRREWIANTGACEKCAPMAGQRAMIGAPFSNGAYTPNDTHVRCRCSEKLVFGVTE